MSSVPHGHDNLPANAPMVTLPDVAEMLDIRVTRVHDMLRERTLIAVRRDDVVCIPADFFTKDGEIVRHVPGLIALLHDGGYSDEEILHWLFEHDDSLPGTPVAALHGHLAREVMRRAQAMAV